MGTARDQGVRELRSRIGSLDVGKDRDRKRKGGVWVGMLVMIECARYSRGGGSGSVAAKEKGGR